MERFKSWFIMTNISNESKLALLKKYNNEENIYNNIDSLDNRYILKGKESFKLKEKSINDVEKFEMYLKLNKIRYTTINSFDYPERLKEIQEPPYVLFYKGNLDLVNDKLVAVVGSRRCTNYGEMVTRQLARELAKMSYSIVSGVAYGIDTISHIEILKNNGKTIGVLGCGIDIIYPKINRKLYAEIEEKGLLISEFLPGTKPMGYNFPRRNRIISGLSKAVIVVEASVKSGSLITVDYALEQGRDVLAVPGSIFNENSIGCNKLIKDGAQAFITIDDLYDFLNEIKDCKKNIQNNTVKDTIRNAISNEPIHIDKIIQRVNVDRMALFELLFEMQNRNEIICLPGNYYAKLS